MAAVKFSKQGVLPNPIEVDYWVDVKSDPYGSVWKYHNGIDWVDFSLNKGSGGGMYPYDYYTKILVNQLLNNKLDINSDLYQPFLLEGENIKIDRKTNTISAVGELSVDWDTIPNVPNNLVTSISTEDEVINADETLTTQVLRKNELTLTEEEKAQVRSNIGEDRVDAGGMNHIVLRRDLSFSEQVTKENTIYEIRYDFDLNEEEVTIPEGCVLNFQGGSLKYGFLNGQNTQIIDVDNSIFNKITIRGSWSIPVIKSIWFNDIHENNCLKNLINMSSDNIHNDIVIDRGDYYFEFTKNLESGIEPKNNSTIILNGVLNVLPNEFKNYQVINIFEKKNITVEGCGGIIGDVETHTGTTGEWGIGVNIESSENITIRGIFSNKCWGDGFYIGVSNISKHCHRILLDNVSAYYNRRQGCSIIDGEVTISNSRLKETGKIKYTAPGFNIDIEPNDAENAFLKVKIVNCDLLSEETDNHAGTVANTFGNSRSEIVIDNCKMGYLAVNGKAKYFRIYNSTFKWINVAQEESTSDGTEISLFNCVFDTIYDRTTNGSVPINVYDSVITTYNPNIVQSNIIFHNCKFVAGGNRQNITKRIVLSNNAVCRVDLPNTSYNLIVRIYENSKTSSAVSEIRICRDYINRATKQYTKISNNKNNLTNEAELLERVLTSILYKSNKSEYGDCFYMRKLDGSAIVFHVSFEYEGYSAHYKQVNISTEVIENDVLDSYDFSQYYGTEGNIVIDDISAPKVPFLNVSSNAYYDNYYRHIIIGQENNHVGSYEDRPTDVYQGFEYFDNTVKKPIYYSEGAYIDSNGTNRAIASNIIYAEKIILSDGQCLKILMPRCAHKTLIKINGSGLLHEECLIVRGSGGINMSKKIYTKFFKENEGNSAVDNFVTENDIYNNGVIITRVILNSSSDSSYGDCVYLHKINNAACNFDVTIECLATFNNAFQRNYKSIVTEIITNPLNDISQFYGKEGNVVVPNISNPLIPLQNIDDNYYYDEVYRQHRLGEKTVGNLNGRPIFEEGKCIGYVYFDTTVGKPIWWTGDKWVDATGAEV